MNEEEIKKFCETTGLSYVPRDEFKTEYAHLNYLRCLLTIKKELDELKIIAGPRNFKIKGREYNQFNFEIGGE